jgi:hypothetical protein
VKFLIYHEISGLDGSCYREYCLLKYDAAWFGRKAVFQRKLLPTKHIPKNTTSLPRRSYFLKKRDIKCKAIALSRPFK